MSIPPFNIVNILPFRNVDKIKHIKLNCYFSFMQGAKSANSNLFKDFCNETEMEKNF